MNYKCESQFGQKLKELISFGTLLNSDLIN